MYIFVNLIIIELAVWFVRRFLAGSMGNAAYFFDTKVTFWGVLHHELSHAIAGILTGAKILKFDGYHVEQEEKTLGSVQFLTSKNSALKGIQLFCISIAPLIGAYATCSILFYFLLSPYTADAYSFFDVIGTWRFWLFLILATPIIYHADLSKQDMFNAIKGIWVLILIIGILYFLTPELITNLNSLSSYIRNMSLLLLVPPFVIGCIIRGITV